MELVEQAAEWLKKVYSTRTKTWTYGWLQPEQVPDKMQVAPLSPGNVYLTLTLQSMRVVDLRRGLKRFYGVVQSYVSAPHLSGQDAEFSTIISPDNLKDLDGENIDRVVTVGKTLVGPIPYHGSLTAEVGLFSVVSDKYAERFITLLDSMSQIAGVSYISAAMPYVEPLKQGISLLTHLDKKDSILEIGLSKSFKPLTSGWFFVMRAPKGQIVEADLKVTEDDYRLVDSAGNLVEDYPYMVFQVTARPDRLSDWFMIPELSESYNRLKEAVRNRNYNDAEEKLASFKVITLTCDDLIERDRFDLTDKVETEVERIMQRAYQALEKPGEGEQLPNLKGIGLYS